MIVVRELNLVDRPATRLWISDQVHKAIRKRDGASRARLLARLKRYMENGFRNYEGADLPIRHERRRVYRIGHEDDLFRIIGFYESAERRSFIAIDAFRKRGQALSASQTMAIDEVARVREQNDWTKDDRNE